ncbi:hypothetical protein COCSADRAFT_301737 [Bipolaris sorokiniana ND90Pr]|uniref:Uncharacterized protein n=1 Tax=Cochliobolus sativus (strain ND90Pr / ATCC 201652) TaxID=665912 RepID=M2SWR1_COCSN|nr:uncharacterized protein COCSADRAFT_301737 [Bipolaris sorokiniana ND90Pr]EMD66735.1 hypothetical protein COCSADRAFT_301737 [Bipolaris sorokiniana ND90Pr]
MKPRTRILLLSLGICDQSSTRFTDLPLGSQYSLRCCLPFAPIACMPQGQEEAKRRHTTTGRADVPHVRLSPFQKGATRALRASDQNLTCVNKQE